MSPTSSQNGSSRTFRASQGLGGKTGNDAHRSYPHEGSAGSVQEYDKLADATRRYYSDRGLWFDLDSFDASYETFLDLLSEL